MCIRDRPWIIVIWPSLPIILFLRRRKRCLKQLLLPVITLTWWTIAVLSFLILVIFILLDSTLTEQLSPLLRLRTQQNWRRKAQKRLTCSSWVFWIPIYLRSRKKLHKENPEY